MLNNYNLLGSNSIYEMIRIFEHLDIQDSVQSNPQWFSREICYNADIALQLKTHLNNNFQALFHDKEIYSLLNLV